MCDYSPIVRPILKRNSLPKRHSARRIRYQPRLLCELPQSRIVRKWHCVENGNTHIVDSANTNRFGIFPVLRQERLATFQNRLFHFGNPLHCLGKILLYYLRGDHRSSPASPTESLSTLTNESS